MLRRNRYIGAWRFIAGLLLFVSSSLFAEKVSIDILIVYTPTVKAVYVDAYGVWAKAQEIVTKANLAFKVFGSLDSRVEIDQLISFTCDNYEQDLTRNLEG